MALELNLGRLTTAGAFVSDAGLGHSVKCRGPGFQAGAPFLIYLRGFFACALNFPQRFFCAAAMRACPAAEILFLVVAKVFRLPLAAGFACAGAEKGRSLSVSGIQAAVER